MRSIKHRIFVYGIWLNGFLANILYHTAPHRTPLSLVLLLLLLPGHIPPRANCCSCSHKICNAWALACHTNNSISIALRPTWAGATTTTSSTHTHTHTHTHRVWDTHGSVCGCGHPELTVLYIRQALQFASYSSPLPPQAVSFLCRLVAGWAEQWARGGNVARGWGARLQAGRGPSCWSCSQRLWLHLRWDPELSTWDMKGICRIFQIYNFQKSRKYSSDLSIWTIL